MKKWIAIIFVFLIAGNAMAGGGDLLNLALWNDQLGSEAIVPVNPGSSNQIQLGVYQGGVHILIPGKQHIIRHPDGSESTVRKFGNQMLIENPKGETVIRPFGSQTIVEGPNGQTTIVFPFGNQTIVEGPNGQTTILDRDDNKRLHYRRR